MTFRHIPDAPELDAERFQQLLDMVGQSVVPELLLRLDEDLRGVAAGLVRGAGSAPDTPPDWDELRGQTHVLISLAGTVGATRLHLQAQALNRQAHDQTAAGLTAAVATVCEGITRLLADIAAREARR